MRIAAMNITAKQDLQLFEIARHLGNHKNNEETLHYAMQYYINYLRQPKKPNDLWDIIQELRNSPDFDGIENVDEIFNCRSKETGREINL